MEIVVFIILIGVIILLFKIEGKVNRMSEDTDEVLTQMLNMKYSLEELEERLNRTQTPSASKATSADKPVVEESALSQPAPSEPVIVTESIDDIEVADNEVDPAESADIPLPPPFDSELNSWPKYAETLPRRNFEKIIGENLFSKIGILALIIGMGFFVKYAIDNDWINEVGRTILGLVVGVGLFGVAYPLRDSYRTFSSVLAGGGFAVCFVTLAVAYNYYRIMPSWVTFAVLVMLTALMILIALRFDRRELAVVAVIGGFVAPFLSSGDSSSSLMLLSYTLILGVAAAVMTIRCHWWELSVVGCVATWIVAILVYFNIKDSVADNWTLFGFTIIYSALYASPIVSGMALMTEEQRQKTLIVRVIAYLVNIIIPLVIGIGTMTYLPVVKHIEGLLPLTLAAINGVLLYRNFIREAPAFVRGLLLAAVISCAVVAWFVQFSDIEIIAVGLAAYIAVLTMLYGYTRNRICAIFAIATSVVDVCYICDVINSSFIDLNTEYMPDVWTIALSGAIYVTLSAWVSRNFSRFDDDGRRIQIIVYSLPLWAGCALLSVSAYLFAAVHFSYEIALMTALLVTSLSLTAISLFARRSGYLGWAVPVIGVVMLLWLTAEQAEVSVTAQLMFWASAALYVVSVVRQVRQIYLSDEWAGPFGRHGFALMVTASGTLFVGTVILDALWSVGLTRYYSAGVSVALILCGALAMTAGMRYRNRPVRMASLGLFAIVLAKLVLYDLWGLPVIGRIIVSILLGVVLLAISFSYQRLRKSLF